MAARSTRRAAEPSEEIFVDEREQELLEQAAVRLDTRAWGLTVGAVLGLGLFASTLFLVVKGGPNVGQHLELLSVYFPGYRVTVLGSFLGFVYAFVVGYGVGYALGRLYNWMADLAAR